MAIAQVRKVLIATHKSEEKIFLNRLQELGILHIIKKLETQESAIKTSIKETLDDISSSIEYLQNFTEKQSFLAGLAPTKKAIDRTEYAHLAEKYDLDATITDIKDIRQKLSVLSSHQKSIESEINTLAPWKELKYDLTDIYRSKRTEIILGQFPTQESFQLTQDAIKELSAYIEIINKEREVYYCIIAYPKNLKESIRTYLQKFEIIDLSKFTGIPENIIRTLSQQRKNLINEIKTKINDVNKLVSELPKLQTLYDYYYNIQSQEEIKPGFFQTAEVVFIEGWVKKKDFKQLEKLIDSFKTIVITPLTKQEDEESPVALENPKIFRPFEIILDLYTMPQSNEIDPTPLLAPFFAIFFGLCITDAGYGLTLLILSLILLRKLKSAEKFLKLLVICSIVTIPAGAITGGWFGDLIDKLGVPFLITIRDKLLLFDPIKNPIPFLILSLGIGYIHLNYGIIIEIVDSFRQKNSEGAIFEQLPWFLLINGLISYFLAGKFIPISTKPFIIVIILVAMTLVIVFTRRKAKLMLNQSFWSLIFLGALILIAVKFKILILPYNLSSWLVGKYTLFAGLLAQSTLSLIQLINNKKLKLLPSIFLLTTVLTLSGYLVSILPVYAFLFSSIILIMLSPNNRRLIKSLVWGAYTLYGGTSYIGIILSYIRLMALGMTTAGIAIPINTIAWMFIKIPVAGILLAIIVLIGGHTFNLLINILGAFVHSIRLNYVEFFPRFFTGGGEKFAPFQRQMKYVTIK